MIFAENYMQMKNGLRGVRAYLAPPRSANDYKLGSVDEP